MSGFTLHAALRSAFVLAALAAACLSATSCSKKSVLLPNDGLEGIPSGSQLVVWRDTPSQDSVFADLGAAGPSPDDTLISVHDIYYAGPGQVQGMIFDYTAADRFDVFRRESGAFRPFKDFSITPSKRLPKGETDLFRFLDQPPTAGSEDYIGRGLVEGVGPASAPKTNVGVVGAGRVSGNLQYIGPTGIRPDIRPLDSLLTMEWNPVPAAAGYWVHVYQLTDQGGEQIVLSGTPAPVYVDVVRDYLMAYLPAPTTSYHIGDPLPPGGRIVTSRLLVNGLDYQVRISAVDANGQLIAYTGTAGAYGIFRGETTYRKFPLGSAIVHPNRRVVGPGATEPAGAIPTSNPRLTIYPSGATPHR